MAKDEDRFEKGVGCIVAVVALAVGCPLRGFALSRLWEWFAIPQFHVRPIGAASALGLSFLYGLFRGPTTQKRPDETDAEYSVRTSVELVVYPAIALGFGWITKGFL